MLERSGEGPPSGDFWEVRVEKRQTVGLRSRCSKFVKLVENSDQVFFKVSAICGNRICIPIDRPPGVFSNHTTCRPGLAQRWSMPASQSWRRASSCPTASRGSRRPRHLGHVSPSVAGLASRSPKSCSRYKYLLFFLLNRVMSHCLGYFGGSRYRCSEKVGDTYLSAWNQAPIVSRVQSFELSSYYPQVPGCAEFC